MSDRFANLTGSEVAAVVLTENLDDPRYIVIPASVTGHCCFGFSVVDRTACNDTGYPPICEWFEEAEAERIAAALNEQDQPADFDRDPSHLPKETTNG